MRIVEEARARGVAPEQALAWWADFREGRHDHAFVPGQERTILDRSAGRVTMRDDIRLGSVLVFREHTAAWQEDNAVRFEGTNTVCRFHGAYFFLPDGEGGTLVRLEADLDLKGALKAGGFLARPIAKAILRADLARHAEELSVDLGGAAARG